MLFLFLNFYPLCPFLLFSYSSYSFSSFSFSSYYSYPRVMISSIFLVISWERCSPLSHLIHPWSILPDFIKWARSKILKLEFFSSFCNFPLRNTFPQRNYAEIISEWEIAISPTTRLYLSQ